MFDQAGLDPLTEVSDEPRRLPRTADRFRGDPTSSWFPTKTGPETTTSQRSGHGVQERDPVILKLANSWLILNVGGGPTDDKPTVTLTTPQDPDQMSAFINLRVADIAAAYGQARSGGFL
jgi:hypothetical protein